MAVYGEDEILYPIDDKNQEVYHAVSSLKNKVYNDETENTEEFLKKYTVNRADKPGKEVISYYCAICGRSVMLTNAKVQKLPPRQTDGALILDTVKYFLKHYLTANARPKVIRYPKGCDVILEYKCECSCIIGYSSLNGLSNVANTIDNTNIKGVDTQIEKTFFILADAIVFEAKSSQVWMKLAEKK